MIIPINSKILHVTVLARESSSVLLQDSFVLLLKEDLAKKQVSNLRGDIISAY